MTTSPAATELPRSVAQILAPNGTAAGAGFLVTGSLLVTCAHVVEAAGSGPGGRVEVAFPHAAGAPRGDGHVLAEQWCAPEAGDVAVVRLATDTTPAAEPLPLGSAAGCRGHQVRSFGFPAQAPPEGHFGFGVAGDLLPASEGRGMHLQLTAANDLTTGFSGGPVLDEATGLVIGMLTEITAPDPYERGQGVAYVTPTQVLREVLPELAEQDVCPYQGLETFTAEQARWFEGRGEAVRQVVSSLARGQRLTLLLGPSGSGKSSLIQAGVLRALAAGELPGSDRWLPVSARPRQDLRAELEHAGLPGAAEGITGAVSRRLAAEPDHDRVLLVIDQFEEFFTQPVAGTGTAEQITAAVDSPVELSVILVMRDDFYPQLAAQAPRLLEAAMPGLLNVPATLSWQDLHDIITLPAQDVGARFQAGLPEQIISDVLATTPDGVATRQVPATVLPLLELALSQLWQRRQDGYLTHEAYRRIGAVTGSLTTWCDTALNQLSNDRRVIAQHILTSLVRPEDPSRQIPATRAQIPLDELRDLAADTDSAGERHPAVDDVIAALTRHRIITTQTRGAPERPNDPPGRPVAELIHDALIHDWGTLREWVSQDHRFQEWLDRTREQRARWTEKSDPGDLLGGTALAEGLEWARQRHLPSDITSFLTASRKRQQAVLRRSRRLNTVLAVLLVVAVVAAGAVWQWRTAITARQTAIAARQAAVSRELAVQSNALVDANLQLASLLAITAYRTSATPESLEILQSVGALPRSRRLAGHTQEVSSVAFSTGGETLAMASADKSVQLWDLASGKLRTAAVRDNATVESVAFSPTDPTIAATADETSAKLWDASTGTMRRTLAGHDGRLSSVAFSPDGKMVATGSADKTARLWDANTGKTHKILIGHTDAVSAVAFSRDGRTLATGSKDSTVRLWDTNTGRARAVLHGHIDAVSSVAFSPDGSTLASGSHDRTVRAWDYRAGTVRATLGHVGPPTFIGHTDRVTSVAFSPDGRTLASGSNDRTVRLWDVATSRSLARLTGHSDTVSSVAFSPDNRTLASGSADKTTRLWNASLPEPTAAIKQICKAVGRDLTPEERTAYLPGQSVGPVCPSS